MQAVLVSHSWRLSLSLWLYQIMACTSIMCEARDYLPQNVYIDEIGRILDPGGKLWTYHLTSVQLTKTQGKTVESEEE